MSLSAAESHPTNVSGDESYLAKTLTINDCQAYLYDDHIYVHKSNNPRLVYEAIHATLGVTGDSRSFSSSAGTGSYQSGGSSFNYIGGDGTICQNISNCTIGMNFGTVRMTSFGGSRGRSIHCRDNAIDELRSGTATLVRGPSSTIMTFSPDAVTTRRGSDTAPTEYLRMHGSIPPHLSGCTLDDFNVYRLDGNKVVTLLLGGNARFCVFYNQSLSERLNISLAGQSTLILSDATYRAKHVRITASGTANVRSGLESAGLITEDFVIATSGMACVAGVLATKHYEGSMSGMSSVRALVTKGTTQNVDTSGMCSFGTSTVSEPKVDKPERRRTGSAYTSDVTLVGELNPNASSSSTSSASSVIGKRLRSVDDKHRKRHKTKKSDKDDHQ